MSTPVVLARFALATLFALAGTAKLASRDATREAIVAFGLPRRFVPAAAFVLPTAELSLSAALFLPAAARWGAVGAITLLALFSLLIGASLARGRHPDCNCFGRLGAARVGWRSLLRNVALLAVAVIAAQPVGDKGQFTSPIGAAHLVVAGMGAALLVQGYLLWQLASQNRRLLERLGNEVPAASPATAHRGLQPVPVGAPAPAFALSAPSGGTVSLDQLVTRFDRDIALVFARPGCSACDRVITHLAARPDLPGPAVVVIASSGAAETAALLAGAQDHPIVLAGDEAVGASYGVGPVPSAVLVDREGLTASEVVVGEAAVLALLTTRCLHPVGR